MDYAGGTLLQHGECRVVSAYYYDKLLRAKIHLLHSTYFTGAFIENTQHCVSACCFSDIISRVPFAIVKNCGFIKKNCARAHKAV